VQSRRSLRLLLLGLACAVAPPAGGQDATGPVIDAIEVRGHEQVSESYIRGVLRMAPGDPADQAALDQAVRRLLRTGKFLTAEVTAESRDGRRVVLVTVAERPALTDVRFLGNAEFNDQKLREMVPLQAGDPVDPFTVREGADNIAAAYRDKGYGNVTVTYDGELLREAAELVYTIEEGPRVRVRKILFEGNESLPREKLLEQVQTKTYLWIFRDGFFDPDQVEQDAAAVQRLYRDEGYLEAKASYRVEPGEDPEDLTVVFLVAEGARYLVESVVVTGNALFSTEELLAELRTRPEQYLRQIELRRDQRDIAARYGERGYIYREVDPVWLFSETPGFVEVRFEITEGEPYRVGRVVPRGNRSTKDKVVRRALELFPDEDVINLSELEEAERRLRETRIFSYARITPVGEQEGVRDLIINVEENEQVGDLLFGFGVNSNSGLVGNVVLDMKNFDLFDWPRSFGEFIRFRSFRGAGQRLRLEAAPGTEVSRFRIDFVEPYLLDKPLRLGTSAFYFERGRESYDERRVGGTVSLGRRIEKGWLEGWYVEGALRSENVDVGDLDLFAPRDVREVEGGNFLTSVKGTLVRDRTDSRLLPTRGDVLRLSWEQYGALGGEHFFGKVLGSYTRHWTLYEDVEDRKGVLSLRGDVGGIFGEAPVFERFYAGGIGSIRGFDFRGVSPRQGLDDDPVGGDFLALLKAEYTFPLVGEALRGVLFSDMGTVEEGFELSTWRASVGVGVRLQVDLLGPVPMEFDLAVPLSSDENDDEQIFSFFIGATF